LKKGEQVILPAILITVSVLSLAWLVGDKHYPCSK